jgi:serine/threonine-protein kinase SRPK3
MKGMNTFKLFPEEPLHQSGDQGFGFFPARAGLLLNNGRYEILRKLGRGQYFTTWLVFDSRCVAIDYLNPVLPTWLRRGARGKKAPVYYSVKILTVHATKGHLNGHLPELEIMKAIRKLKCNRLPYLFDHFETDGPHGRHLCLVQPVLSTSVDHFRLSAPSKKLGFPTVKIIIAQVLEALVALHSAQIVHMGE